MEFIKAHYEKVILSIVLVGLAAAAALMPMKVRQEQQRKEERQISLIRPKVKEFPPVDLSSNALVLARMEQPTRFKIGGEHNVFNPVRWQRRADGGLLKGSEAGVNALQVAEITPLRLRVAFEGVNLNSDTPKYQLVVLNEARSARPINRQAELRFKNNLFTIESVSGDPQDPTELKVLLEGDKEAVIISKDNPHERIIGYKATLHYPPENRTWRDVKARDELSFGGETYNIVAITANEVVLSAKSNNKQTTLEYKAPPR